MDERLLHRAAGKTATAAAAAAAAFASVNLLFVVAEA